MRTIERLKHVDNIIITGGHENRFSTFDRASLIMHKVAVTCLKLYDSNIYIYNIYIYNILYVFMYINCYDNKVCR